MKYTYAPRQYKCPACQAITKHYVWSNEVYITTHSCTCGGTLTGKNLFEPKTPTASAIRTPTKNR